MAEAWEERIPAEMEPLVYIGAGKGSGLEARTDTAKEGSGRRALRFSADAVDVLAVDLDERETAAMGAALAHSGVVPDGTIFSSAYSKALAQTPGMSVGELRLLAHQALSLAFEQVTALAKAAGREVAA